MSNTHSMSDKKPSLFTRIVKRYHSWRVGKYEKQFVSECEDHLRISGPMPDVISMSGTLNLFDTIYAYCHRHGLERKPELMELQKKIITLMRQLIKAKAAYKTCPNKDKCNCR